MKVRFVMAGLIAAIAGSVLACTSAPGPTGPGDPRPAFARGGVPNIGVGTSTNLAKVVYCDPRPTETSSVEVGPAGATIWTGVHRLKIPPGALATRVTITMTVPSDTAAVVEFLPEGLRFNTAFPPTLTMSLNGCAVPPVKNLAINYVDDLFTILEKLPTKWNGNSGTVQAGIHHFSRYAVAW